MAQHPLHIETPLIEHRIISERLGKRVFLKMECYQPSGSFKMRGISRLCQDAVRNGAASLVSSSGGNAGYTAAYVGRLLNVPVTVVTPESTSELAKQRMAAEGAEIIVHGTAWDDADVYARQYAADNNGAYIHPFDDERVWQGHATMIDEIVGHGTKPDVIVLSVGGGGLLCGVVAGLHRHGWTDVPVLTVETEGAASFAESIRAGEHITLPAITSIAKTLGSLRVTPKALEWAQRHTIIPITVTDRDAVNACLQFADDQRVVVEPACGAALSVLYDHTQHIAEYETVLVIVCGGVSNSIAQLREWAETLP
ncbi:MAG: pyridoxal-phosphate dependent enzyme [Chloroflexi bacterium]|nr:MAG: pyridoxal-phosphate dependent enzyme [Chloroflexota bacterium]